MYEVDSHGNPAPKERVERGQTPGVSDEEGHHWRVATEALGGSVQWNQAVVRANSVELYSQGAVHLMCSGPANSVNIILSRQTRLSQEKEDGV